MADRPAPGQGLFLPAASRTPTPTTASGLLLPDMSLTAADLEELEACNALHETRHITMPQLMGDWQQSAYREASFHIYLSSRYGGQNIGRSAELRTALTSSTKIMQERLGLKPDVTDVQVSAHAR